MFKNNINISFGIIVLNGEPFTKYCLRALYPFAYEIIIAEGACKAAKGIATPDGHSIDGTLESLYEFKEKEDPENKLTIIQKSGFWEEKDEQSKAYAEKAKGNYLWQVDIDEFYRDEDILKIINILKNNKDITAVSFKERTFWGDLCYECNSVKHKVGGNIFHRLFKFKDGYIYKTHRPPTVVDENGQDLRKKKHLIAEETEKEGIYLYHYSLLLPKQVKEKVYYYQQRGFYSEGEMSISQWAESCYFRLSNPYQVFREHEYPSWLERFDGSHPEQIQKLMEDIKTKKINYELRNNNDVEELLQNNTYNNGVEAIKKTIKLSKTSNKRIVELLEELVTRIKKWFIRKVFYK